ncbi:two component transcriptional regulator, LuxR family [Methylobacterium sp. 4-46]|uniref:LuxR C-terminal-related transcriptional regulator n=1 Tax=unclassified Methylobacterium TaxID=2615210 RepID=UPI000152D618|nr:MULTISPECIES: response regulator transcription factor [Methylobacterium]ACA19309.1 two component transcriptional regulator, LuxR family [Methylobacterium sp. 4-46]WFT78512.1 response regulator transcription factor [Methylobacterium nodulans]
MPEILLVDEHSVYRVGLRNIIEANLDKVRITDASSLAQVDKNFQADLVLIDAFNLSKEALERIKEMRVACRSMRFAVMSSSNARSDVLNCLSAGFHGFIYKMQPDSELIRAITDLLSGRIYVPRWLADGDDVKPNTPASIALPSDRLKLTPRQHEILPLLAQGMSNKEIANSLNIAAGTAKIHTAALLRALGARNRTEAAFIAAKLVGGSPQTETRAGNPFIISGFGEHAAGGVAVHFRNGTYF